MINESVKKWLAERGFAERLTEHTETIDTVEHAAQQIGCSEVEELTGFPPGGVCPFGVPEGIPIWLDVSMKRFEYVHPAGGNEFASVKLSPDELEMATDSVGWCDVCKGWEE